MLTRTLATLALIFVFYLLPGQSAMAQFTPQLEPCFAKTMPQLKSLPAGTPIIQSIGHIFRNSDKCAPFFVTFTWENHYDQGDGYSHYSLNFVYTFRGELWYRTDKEEFTLAGDPAHWQGINKIGKFDGYGQSCVRLDEKGACTELHRFDRGQVRPLKTGGDYLGALTYGFPAVTTQGVLVPIDLHALSPSFEFRNSWHEWHPNGGLIEINNPALVSFDFRALTKAAKEWESYSTTINYNQDNDTEDMPSGHKGRLVIKLDFDQFCEGENNKDMEPCKQTETLLDDLKLALELRDLYPAVLPDATSEFDIDKLVLDQLRLSHPSLSSKDEAWMLNNAGGTNPKTLDISIPDYCDKCSAQPLCKWRGDVMEVHENTHVQYLLQNPADRQTLIAEHATDTVKHSLDKAKITSDMEYRAYNERAKAILELIKQQLNQSTGCTFNPQFYPDLDALKSRIDYNVTIKKQP